jgi:hypothetical protein
MEKLRRNVRLGQHASIGSAHTCLRRVRVTAVWFVALPHLRGSSSTGCLPAPTRECSRKGVFAAALLFSLCLMCRRHICALLRHARDPVGWLHSIVTCVERSLVEIVQYRLRQSCSFFLSPAMMLSRTWLITCT